MLKRKYLNELPAAPNKATSRYNFIIF